MLPVPGSGARCRAGKVRRVPLKIPSDQCSALAVAFANRFSFQRHALDAAATADAVEIGNRALADGRAFVKQPKATGVEIDARFPARSGDTGRPGLENV